MMGAISAEQNAAGLRLCEWNLKVSGREGKVRRVFCRVFVIQFDHE